MGQHVHRCRSSDAGRAPALLLAVGLAAVSMFVVTLEWSFPYCEAQVDGPASAIFGLPLPYTSWSQASSLEFNLEPLAASISFALRICSFLPLCFLVQRLAIVQFGRRVVVLLTISGALLVSRCGCSLAPGLWSVDRYDETKLLQPEFVNRSLWFSVRYRASNS